MIFGNIGKYVFTVVHCTVYIGREQISDVRWYLSFKQINIMIVSTTTNNWSLLTRNNTHRSHLRLLLWCSGPFRSTTRLIRENQFHRYLLFCLSVPRPGLQMSRKLFNYYIWHIYYREQPASQPVTLHHVHLLPLFGLYGKYRGLGIFPSIVIDLTETNLIYLWQFLWRCPPLAGLYQYFRYLPLNG